MLATRPSSPRGVLAATGVLGRRQRRFRLDTGDGPVAAGPTNTGNDCHDTAPDTRHPPDRGRLHRLGLRRTLLGEPDQPGPARHGGVLLGRAGLAVALGQARRAVPHRPRGRCAGGRHRRHGRHGAGGGRLDAVLRRAQRRRGGGACPGARRHRRGRADLLPARARGAARRPGRGDLRDLGGVAVHRLGDLAAGGARLRPAAHPGRLRRRDLLRRGPRLGLGAAGLLRGPVRGRGGRAAQPRRHRGPDRVRRRRVGPDPTVRPHWQVHFSVPDVTACARAAELHGGSVLREGSDEAVLRDPDGAQFTVTSRRER
ncbi:VOC family protein [Streptomyces pharetrae]|uniref:VOC family protein n=1 Tax=Streptomyces pharetrae TaxID=291370 RepID=UPI00384E440A